MKLKQLPEDFQVVEVTGVKPASDGPFAFYRLEKSGWTTPDAVAVVRRRWKIELRRFSYAGLKDRHAHTVQYLTVFHGPRRNLKQNNIRVQYLGQLTQPYTSRELDRNQFRIVLRDMSADEVAGALAALDEVRQDGVPNYFDDQRFGSVGGKEFVARLMVLRRHEDALRLALTEPYEFDRAASKREKAVLRQCWGDWSRCRLKLPQGHARRIIDFLANNPGDFGGALARLRPELRGLYLSAYQSHLWNRMLATWLQRTLPATRLGTVPLRLGNFPVYRQLDAAERVICERMKLILPSREELDPNDPQRALVAEILRADEITIDQMKLKSLPTIFFSKGERDAVFQASDLAFEVTSDDRNSGHMSIVLSFSLIKGAYATMLVKRVTSARFTPHVDIDR